MPLAAVSVTVAMPPLTAVTRPEESTVATVLSSTVHLTRLSSAFSLISYSITALSPGSSVSSLSGMESFVTGWPVTVTVTLLFVPVSIVQVTVVEPGVRPVMRPFLSTEAM